MNWIQGATIIFMSLSIIASAGTIWSSSVTTWYSNQTTSILHGAPMAEKPLRVRLFDRLDDFATRIEAQR